MNDDNFGKVEKLLLRLAILILLALALFKVVWSEVSAIQKEISQPKQVEKNLDPNSNSGTR